MPRSGKRVFRKNYHLGIFIQVYSLILIKTGRRRDWLGQHSPGTGGSISPGFIMRNSRKVI